LPGGTTHPPPPPPPKGRTLGGQGGRASPAEKKAKDKRKVLFWGEKVFNHWEDCKK